MGNIEILSIDNFDKEFKKLSRKYRSIHQDLQNLLDEIRENPSHGQALGKNVYKIRMAISSKKKGKSGGSRVITYYAESDSEIYLLSIYDKSEQTTISDAKIIELVSRIPL